MKKIKKQTIRISTWNLGQYIWMGFLGKFFSINGYRNNIQNYNKGNAEKIKLILSKIKPDIFIGQELSKNTDTFDFWGEKHKSIFSPSYYKNFQKLYIGKEDGKISFMEDHKELTIIEFQKFIIFSVHLNAFSSQKRLNETNYICKKAEEYNKPIICLGDFNLWKRGVFFLFTNDRKAYQLITQYFFHATKNIFSTTTTGFALDNIFTRNLTILNSEVVKENGKYMDHYPLYIDFEV